MIQVFAAISAAGLGTAAGLYFSRRLKAREESLRELVRIFREMALLIKHRNLSVRELFTELSNYEFIRAVYDCDNNSSDNANSMNDFKGNWLVAAENMSELSESERSVVKSVGAYLGNSDVSGQLSMLEVNAALLEGCCAEAHEQYVKKGNLYRSVGILAGLFVAVLVS